MPQDLRPQIATLIRADLAAEADAGFPLLRRFPNSETAGVPDYVARLGDDDRNALFDALAHYSTLQWSQEVVREKRAHPILGPYLAKRPVYPAGDWYGARPRKSALKKTMRTALESAGHLRKTVRGSPSDVLEFIHPDLSFTGILTVSFNPGLIRQMDFGFRGWLRPGLMPAFDLLQPREFIPALSWLAYDHIWHGAGVNNPVCWDLVTEENLEATGHLFVEVLERLTRLAVDINRLGGD